MNVFLSWSGEASKAAATALRTWLLDVFQSLDVWMSAHDISAGAPWTSELHRRLESSDFGILLLTRENLKAPWLIYEAGCLVMSVQPNRVVPYCLDLPTAQVPLPLGQLQSVGADSEGTWKLLQSLNAAMDTPLPEARLQKLFEKWWPDLCQAMASHLTVEQQDDVTHIRVDVEDLLEERVPLEIIKQRLFELANAPNPRLVLDLRRVQRISSTAVGMLVSTHRIVWRSKGETALVVNEGPLTELLKMSRLDRYFNAFQTMGEAVTHVRKPTEEQG